MADPVDQLGLAGVGREAAQRVHLRVHRDALVHQLDGPGAIDDRPPQRAAGLEAGYHQVTFLAPEVVLEMMQDAPAGAHAAAGDDDHAALEAVDGHRVLGGGCGFQHRQPALDAVAAVLLRFDGRLAADFQLLLEMRVDGVGADRHGAVEEHGLLWQATFLIEHAQVVDQVLGAAHGEGGHQDVATVPVGLMEDRLQFVDGRLVVAMVAVAVGRFHQHHVRLLQ